MWRAVLPHAIANRLAALALENIPLATIEAQLIANAPVRLVKSFSRRLGYLHGSKDAVAIVENWLATDSILGNVANLNEVGDAMLNNVAPAAPEAVLAAFERALFGPDCDKAVVSCVKHVRLLRSLAHDPALFERCTSLLLKLAKEAGEDSKSHSAATVFVSVFFLYLSGTHATIEQRLRVIEPLLLSDDSNQRSLGLKALKATLETGPFTSDYQFEFGARSRDHGYWPRNGGEVRHWYASVLKLTETLACSDRPIAPRVCATVGKEFRGLWNIGMYDELELLCRAISGKKFWPEGWIAVRETLNFDSQRFPPEIVARLSLLEAHLRPTDLVQKVRAIVLSDSMTGLDLDDFEGKSTDDPAAEIRKTEAIARGLGKAVANDARTFDELLGELVSGRGRLTPFGQGLLEGALDPKATWDRLVAQLATKGEGEQNVQILVGFLSALQVENPLLADALLDDAAESEMLFGWYPVFQATVRIDAKGVDRIRRSLAFGRTPIGRYDVLAWDGAPDQISAQDLKELVITIAAKPDGFNVALEMLGMRLYSDDRKKQGHAFEILDAGRELLRQLRFTKKTNREDHRLEIISKACLVGEEGAEVARRICRKLKASVAKYETYSFNNSGLLQGLLTAQPAPISDALCSGDTAEIKQGIRILEDGSRHSKNLLDVVPEGDLLDWCDKEPNSRYAIVAAGITWSLAEEETGARRWTNIALAVLKKAPDRVAVLKEFVRRFRLMSWSGSRATILATNVKLLDELGGYFDPTFIEFIAREKVLLNKEIEAERRARLWPIGRTTSALSEQIALRISMSGQNSICTALHRRHPPSNCRQKI